MSSRNYNTDTKNNKNRDTRKSNKANKANNANNKDGKIIPDPPKYPKCSKCNVEIDGVFLFEFSFQNEIVCDACYYNLAGSNNPDSDTNKPPIIHTNNQPKFNLFYTPPPYSTPSFPPPLMHPPLPPPFFIKFTTPINQNNRDNQGNKDNKRSKTGKKNDKPDTKNKEIDPGMLFLNKVLNTLNKIDNPGNSSSSDGCGECNGCNGCSDNYDQDDDYDLDNEEDDKEPEPILEFEWLGANITSIDDLIALGKSYDSKKRKRYNLNLKQLNSLVEPLTELKNMIGMKEVKKIIFDQLIYYLQNLDDKNVDMLHTVITGPPGVGKTQLTHIIAKIYNRLGFLKSDRVISAKRDDLIGEYVGQTAVKTRKLLDRALGGVLLLDEIYSLAPTSERDFAREAIDMLNMYLSEHAHDLVCVVAGYKKPTYEKFFSQNEGLARRFTHHFEITGYSPEELALIFKKYLEDQKWMLASDLTEITGITSIADIIKTNLEHFPNFGGDMTTLFACCKKTHARRLLTIPLENELNENRKHINLLDITNGIELFKEIKAKNKNTDDMPDKYIHMYS